ncbi:MAG: SDR family NAD(P)-dependent oxidoreductase [Gemmatimonadetes bacterium]|nr:MAG: SDR family NAD(P)-dependent oxidoreductase [Gemmatimonadota bacterium]
MKWTEQNIPDQTGRIVIVTGANTGIGFETARALAEKQAMVILACRNETKGQQAIDRIQQKYPQAVVQLMKLDLSRQQAVREFARQFQQRYDRLDLLINNAGVMVPPYTKTEDGFELQFGTNHLGHFALTGLLLDRLLQTAGSRVVTVSSMAHKTGNINFNDLHWEKRPYNAWQAYSDSKIANLYFTYELQRKLHQHGAPTIATAAHPGWTATDLQRHSGVFHFLNGFFAQTPPQGALPTLRAAVDDTAIGGEYYGPSGFMEIKGYPKQVSSNTRSQNKEIAARLWAISEELTGVHYEPIQ